MIWLATCPLCGLGTRVSSPDEPHEVCKCGVPYDMTDENALPPDEPPPDPGQ